MGWGAGLLLVFNSSCCVLLPADNFIRDDGVAAIASALELNPALTELDLQRACARPHRVTVPECPHQPAPFRPLTLLPPAACTVQRT